MKAMAQTTAKTSVKAQSATRSTHFVMWRKTAVNDTLNLEPYKCAFKGSNDEMLAKFKEYRDKALAMIANGAATDFKEGWTGKDMTSMYVSFVSKGARMTFCFCDRQDAAGLAI